MELPLHFNPNDTVDIVLQDQPLRFRVNYAHNFPSQEALKDFARQAWQESYDGLTQIEGISYADYQKSHHDSYLPAPAGPDRKFRLVIDIELTAKDLDDALSRLAAHLDPYDDDAEPLDQVGSIELYPL